MPEGESLSDLMRDFKKFTSTKIRRQLQEEKQSDSLEILLRNAERVGRKKRQVFKLWMDRFDDIVIHDDAMLVTKVEYIHNNPVKAGLVAAPEDWYYSSAGDYMGIRPGR
jgi:REP element-mobilizing transposase RayT